MKSKVALGLAGAVVALGSVGGVAYAADSSSAPSAPSASIPSPGTATSEAGHQGRAKHRREVASRALHGQFTVERAGEPAVIDVQRGEVMRADATSVTVKSVDGFTTTYAITPQTKIRDKKVTVAPSDLTAGRRVGVLADDAGGHPAAKAIRVLPAKAK